MDIIYPRLMLVLLIVLKPNYKNTHKPKKRAIMKKITLFIVSILLTSFLSACSFETSWSSEKIITTSINTTSVSNTEELKLSRSKSSTADYDLCWSGYIPTGYKSTETIVNIDNGLKTTSIIKTSCKT